MSRYFIEVYYKGTHYAGFQVQPNANTIQAEVEKALAVFFRHPFSLTGSSRTDAGVHALSNYFHFDAADLPGADIIREAVYNINAILPYDIIVKRIFLVSPDAHCRFDATSREYKYFIYSHKDPFLAERAYHYPFTIDMALLQKAAAILLEYQDFSSFSKRNTQVKSFNCLISESNWYYEDNQLVYRVRSNRFLRGMVKGLVGTMLKVGTGKISIDQFRKIIEAKDCARADFSVPSRGLFLINVAF